MTFDPLGFIEIAILVVCCVSAAFVAVRYLTVRAAIDESVGATVSCGLSLYFQNGSLIGSQKPGSTLLQLARAGGSDFERITRLLDASFPGVGVGQSRGATGRDAEFHSRNRDATLKVSRDGDRVMLDIRLAEGSDDATIWASLWLEMLGVTTVKKQELARSLPFPVWRQTTRGDIVWANDQYEALESKIFPGRTQTTETRPIFPDSTDLVPRDRKAHRAKLVLPGETEQRWFELGVSMIGEDLLVVATPVDRLLRAERSLQDFVQTLTQTFAHLNVGLAVFSDNKKLAVFNPALVDLLGLTPEFLTRRPTLFELLDTLRENRMLPEPKNYKSWRNKIADMEAAVKDGVYSETWSLVNGRTYRVTGRPHAEGAIAFLFEDISAEITLERNYRAELQTTQAVFNGLEEAIAVFSPAGEMVLSNKAYRNFCGDENDDTLVAFVEASRCWQEMSQPTPVWGDARDFAARLTERSSWTAEVRLRDGRNLRCRFETVLGGHTLVGFQASATGEVSKFNQPANHTNGLIN